MAPPLTGGSSSLRAAITCASLGPQPSASPSSSLLPSLVSSAPPPPHKTIHSFSPLLLSHKPNTTTTTPFVQRFFTTTTPVKMSSSSMPATGGHSAACCNIPPVVSSGYQKKGAYETLDNKKTYVTGPVRDASRGILVIMDIFGFFDQTIQGCDILATADDHQPYAVFMPDAFDGEPLPIDLFPPDNEEKQKKVGAFFAKNSPPSFVPKIAGILEAAQAKYPNIKEWAAVGVGPFSFLREIILGLTHLM